ncbi:MAG: thioredoxin family protein [Aureibaculum sp.]
MKGKILFVLLLLQFMTYAQAEKEVIHKPNLLIGLIIKEDLQKQPYADWFETNYNDYKIDTAVVKKIKEHLNGVSIKAFMGTWCEDSRYEIPQFYKVMEAAGFNDSVLELIAVDRSKKTPDNLHEGLDIIYIPTFIFFKNNKEIGRFVEYPRETLEKDILKIISGESYKHSYQED